MARLLIHVEGQTEERFVKGVLRDHLAVQGYHSVEARLVGSARQREKRGGIKAWSSVKKEIVHHLRGDSGLIATTMVDYYALPTAWPGRQDAALHRSAQERASAVESALLADLAEEMGPKFWSDRFIPFILMHEFEALLFSDCAAFASAMGERGVAPALQKIRDCFSTPEEIDDSPETAPSKRILGLIERYEKPLMGVRGITAIGLPAIRDACPHFNTWLEKLESLPQF